MPYMVISGSFNIDTKVGGKSADLELMNELGAKKGKMTQLFTTPLTGPEVLNKLEIKGWKVVAMGVVPNGEMEWTLHKDSAPNGPPTYAEKFGQSTF